MKPIKVEFFAPAGPHEHVRTRTILCSSQRKARKAVAKALGTIIATRYTVTRDLERAPSARIVSRRGRGIWMGPKVLIVPSVEELGWTP